jgi:hypothetical protein
VDFCDGVVGDAFSGVFTPVTLDRSLSGVKADGLVKIIISYLKE